MSPDPKQQASPAQASGADGPSAPEHEAGHVEEITPSKDHDHADLEKKEATARVDQDNRVQTIARQAKEAGAGSTETGKELNQDG